MTKPYRPSNGTEGDCFMDALLETHLKNAERSGESDGNS